MTMEFVPIGTVLAALTTQVIKTAQAANDVAFEKESFKVLSNHLFGIEPVLKELHLKKLHESSATRQALEFLDADVKKAKNLVDKYTNRSRFYLLVKCRHIVKEVQDVTREIQKSFAALSIANTDVLSGISDLVNRLKNEMQMAEFETSHFRFQVIDRLNQGLKDLKLDPFEILRDVAKAVGVPDDPAEISKELESFRKEKEEAENRKERAEVFFLGQVIELLSRADTAKHYDEVMRQYQQRVKYVERYDPEKDYIEPYKAFICCITKCVMVDPVSLCTGTACEREALEAWFISGQKTDPQTGDFLEDLSYRPNLRLRQSIQEWKEHNYCLKIRSCKAKLLLGVDSSAEEASTVLMEEALDQMQELMRESSINKDWISIAGLTELIYSILGNTENGDVKKKILVTLKDIIEGHVRNKDSLIENQKFKDIIACLGCDSSVSESAVELLYELLLERSCWNVSYCRKISQQHGAIPNLVTLVKGSVRESLEKAIEILMKICYENEESIIIAAEAGWYKPITKRIIEGPEYSKIVMVRVLVSLTLTEEDIKLLGKEGLIPPLLEMASGKIESKELSLSLLVKLLAYQENKLYIAMAGGVPLVIRIFSSQIRSLILSKCSQVLEKLTSNGDGTKYFVDENGNQLELEPVISHLLAFQQNPTSSNSVWKPALRALLGIIQSDAELVKIAVLKANGVSLVLPLLDDYDLEIREVAINLVFLFSQHEPQGVVDFLLNPGRLKALVRLLENKDKGEIQMAAAGLLANLPKSDKALTKRLIGLDGLRAIVDILRSGCVEAKENALSALFRFTDPTNLESQKNVVEQGAYPLLVDLLNTGSVTQKARSAALIGDLSMRSFELTVSSKGHNFWRICGSRVPKCQAHGGICSVNKSFCLLEANALPELVKLLQEKTHETTYEAIQTLSTLVAEECPYKGAKVLHENGALLHIVEVLNWGSNPLKEEVLSLLEKVFTSREMVEIHGWKARVPLVQLTGRSFHEDGHLQRKAARVLLLIERYSRSSISGVVSGVIE